MTSIIIILKFTNWLSKYTGSSNIVIEFVHEGDVIADCSGFSKQVQLMKWVERPVEASGKCN